MKEKFYNILFMGSALTVVISAALVFVYPDIMRIAFSVGAAGMAVSRLSQQYHGSNLRIKRLYRIQKFGPLSLIFASYLMYQPHNQWVPLLLIAAATELYTVFMIEREERKAQ